MTNDMGGYVSLVNRLGALNTDFKNELARLAGPHPEDYFSNFIALSKPAHTECLWTTFLVDPAVPLAQRAAALVLAMEPCAHGVRGLSSIVCYAWEQTFIGDIQWEKLDPALYELAYLLLITSWETRKAGEEYIPSSSSEEGDLQGSARAGAYASPGTGKWCEKGEYRYLKEPLLWAIKTWKDDPNSMDRLVPIFDRLPINHHSCADIDPLDEWGNAVQLLVEYPLLLGALFDSCRRTIERLLPVLQTNKEETPSFRDAQWTAAGIWNGLATQLARLDKETFLKIVDCRDALIDLSLIWQIPKGFVFPRATLPSQGVLALVGLLEDVDIADVEYITFLRNSTTSHNGVETNLGIGGILEYTLVIALEIFTHRRRTGEKDFNLNGFLDVSSPLARRGLLAIAGQAGFKEGNWVGQIAPHLAAHLLNFAS